MPLFEYKCRKCNNIFETLVTDQNEIIKCNSCDTTDIIKIFSVFGLNKNQSSYSSNREITADSENCCCNTGCGCN